MQKIDELAAPFLQRHDWTGLGDALDAVRREQLPETELRTWFELRGGAAFHQARRDDALRVYREGVARFPRAGKLRFGLGQELEARGDIDGAIVMWRDLDLGSVPASHLMAAARYLYLWDRYADSRLLLRPIFEAYQSLGIADDTFLYLRGLPLYSEAFGSFAAAAILAGEPHVAAERLKADAKLGDLDLVSERTLVAAHTTGDWSAVARMDEKTMAEWEHKGFPVGRHRVRQAAIRSRAAASLDDALRHLDAVTLTEKDHQWLRDVVTMLRCEAFARFGADSRESAELSALRARQPWLFEPEHAFAFGLLAYQERLKPSYRESRGR